VDVLRHRAAGTRGERARHTGFPRGAPRGVRGGERRGAPGGGRVLHATAEGRFVDDASHAHLARQCPERPADLFDGIASNGDTTRAQQPQFRVACARLYGASADEVAAAVERTWPAPPDGGESPAWCYPREQLVRVARVDPPGAFRLTSDAGR